MRIFLAGATGVIGRALVPMLVGAGHAVAGTTRSPDKAARLKAQGATAVVVNVFDADALSRAVVAAQPEVVIHQLTDLPPEPDPDKLAAAREANAGLRMEGTRNLVAATRAAGARRLIAQSLAFVYAPGPEPHDETDPLDPDPRQAASVRGAVSLEQQVLGIPGVDGIVLRYGRLYGPGTWNAKPSGKISLHVETAAAAALLAVTRGTPGIYNIAEDDGSVSIAKARRELGFDPPHL